MRTPFQYLLGVRHPEAFHGRGVSGGYFEGWYVKLVSSDGTQRWAVIPGVFRAERGGAAEAFVQVLDGLTGRSWYHRYDADAFAASEREFAVRVGPNIFDASGITVEVPQLAGRIDFATPLRPYPVTARVPGIMGWYGYLPIMECRHGIVSFGHDLAGTLDVEGVAVGFDGGRGYLEKDWGRSFPSAYVWAASNHLADASGERPDGSLMASCAVIPGLGRRFRGSIVALALGGRVRTWATWNGSRDLDLRIDDQTVHWRMAGPDGTLDLAAERVRGGLLHAPLRTAMHRRVEETLDARLRLRLTAPDGATLFDGTGECAGLEVFGDTDGLTRLPARRR